MYKDTIEIFDKITTRVRATTTEYNPNWVCADGEYTYAITGLYAPRIHNNKFLVSRSPKGEIILLVGTSHGNLILFKRDGEIRSNRPLKITTGFESPVNYNDMFILSFILPLNDRKYSKGISYYKSKKHVPKSPRKK